MQPLVRTIEQHLRKTGLTATRFGREATGDPRLVRDLRNGRQPGPAMAARILAFIARRDGRPS